MDIGLQGMILLFTAIFMAGFIDSMAGGGGLISLPAYLVAGFPAHIALGTNKFVNSSGTFVAVINYIRKKKTSLTVILSGFLFSLTGSYLGTRTIQMFDTDQAGKIILFLMPLGLIATFLSGRDEKTVETFSGKSLWLIIPLVCLLIGFYDGFFGPGTGTFLALSFHIFVKMDLLHATANAKVFNLMSNVGALTAFIHSGQIAYAVVVPLMVASILGNYLGSHLAISRGKKLIKTGLYASLFLLMGTMVYRSFFS